jgi:hypothetical protein
LRRPFSDGVQNPVPALDIGPLLGAEVPLLQNRGIAAGSPEYQQGSFRDIFRVVHLPKEGKEISFGLVLEAPDAVSRR